MFLHHCVCYYSATTFANVHLNIRTVSSLAELKANLLDIHNQRLAQMDATGVDFVNPLDSCD